jgi:NADPH2:quinone reductase
VKDLNVGDEVLAMTHFGGYAEYAKTKAAGVVRLAPGTDHAEATALGTQYCTAWIAACHMVNLKKGDRVLVHAAAGGVGTALVQIAK